MSLGIKSSAFLKVEETGASKFEVHTCLQLVGALGIFFQDLVPDFFDMPSTRKVGFEEAFSGILGPKELLSFALHQFFYTSSVAEMHAAFARLVNSFRRILCNGP